MRLILRAEACQLHPDEMLQRNESNSLDGSTRSKLGHGFRIFLPDLFSGEYHVDSSAGWLPLLEQHVDSSHVTVLQPKWLHCLRNPLQILPANDDVDVFG